MTSSSRTPAPAATGARRPSGMEPSAMAEHLKGRLGDAVLDVSITFGQVTVTLAPEALPEAARLCKESPELDFDFYDHNAGVDLGEDGFAVVTHLYSLRHRHHIMLRVVAPGGRETPTVPTLTHLYLGANWHEREAYDMFGIDFEGHPGLLPRILTVENFEGFPLRKDFLLSSREAKPWPGLKEPKEVGADEEAPGTDTTSAAAPAGAEDKAKASQERAERARAKATTMRAAKQAEREAAQAAEPGEARAAGSAGADDDPDAQAAAAQKTTGGDTGGPAAAQVAAAAGEPEPQTPSGAADIARNDIAKDAAAGAVGGDTAAGAPGDAPDSEQPVHDPEAEAKVGEGAPPAPSGTPGVEAQGRHGGAEEHGHASDTDSSDAERSQSPDVDGRPEPSETLEEGHRLHDEHATDEDDGEDSQS